MENKYDEIYAPEYTRVKTEKLEEYETQIEELKNKITDLKEEISCYEEDLTFYKTRNGNYRKRLKDYEELVDVFISNANNLLQSDEDTIAKVFEFIKMKGFKNESNTKN